MGVLRCLTLNTWKNEGRYERRMAAIVGVLQTQQADVVALQECFVAPSLGLDSAEMLAAQAGYQVTRYPMRAKPRWHQNALVASRSDMAILTRAKPEDHGTLALPHDPRDGERGVLWVDLLVGGERLRLGCTHLTHLHDAMAQLVRHQQAATAVAAVTRSADRAAVLMGDLNAPCADPSLAPIFEHPAMAAEARNWAVQPCPGKPPANGGIDHVLLFRGDHAAEDGTPRPESPHMVSRSIVARPDPRDPQGSPSDHPAILAELEFL